MKKILIALASIAALSFIASCTKEEANSVEEQGKQITITASIPEGGLTKVGFTTNGDDLKLAWEVGDQITVSIPNVEPIVSQVFTLTGGAGTKSGTFSGTALPAATKYRISYDGGATYATQTQADTDNAEHLKYAAILNGVSTYSNFTFSQSWATANGGTFTQSSVLRIKAILPGVLDSAVEKVVVKSDANIFAGGNQIVIDLASAPMLGSDNDIIVYASLPGEQVIPAGTKLWIIFQTSDSNAYEKYTAYRELPAMTILAGKVNTIKLNCENIDKYAGKDDDGTAANPYLVGDQHQMAAMAGEMKSGEKRYFKLIDDIDMTGVTWVSLNNSGTFDKEIDFDGQNHVISNLNCNSGGYPSFAGVAYGSYKDFTIESATIDGGGNQSGVFAGYIGTYEGTTYNRAAVCSGITVSNSTLTAAATKKSRNIGCFAGYLHGKESSISNCHVIGTSSATQTTTSYNGCCVGGFIGNIDVEITITNCTAKANLNNAGSYYTGGFIGQIGGAVKVDVTNCAFLGGTIEAGRNATTNSPVGGFIGRIASNAGATITNCYVDGAQITAIQSGRCGGFVGDTGDKDDTHVNTFTSCYVKNTSVSAAQHAGGFGGVFYTTAKKCYVESTTITANAANNGGFVGYPQKATIEDCYVSSSVTVNGGTQNAVGGFVGIAQNGNTIKNCYEAATVTGSSASVGAFIGLLNIAQTSVEKCIAWNATLPFLGSVTDGVSTSEITNNYTGTTGTISGQATSLGWDSSVWDLTGAVPTLK